jgi:amidase
LSEWANFRSTHSSSGWSARGGQGKNPYALDRNTSGSSSGSAGAAAASYCAVAIGTETDGSITSPSAACALVGIKPTVGLIGRSGIIPISPSQDTAGPMARTVRDAAIVLGALTGLDPRDAATRASAGHASTDYTRFLDAAGLRGARIGVIRERYMGYSPKTDALVAQAIDLFRREGATIVDPANIPTAGKFDDAELEVLLYEFKDSLNRYCASLGPAAPVQSLADLIRFNERNATAEMPYFAQELFEMAERKGPLTDAKYRTARATCVRLARTQGIDAVLTRFRLDALVAPTQGPVWRIDLVNGDSWCSPTITTPPAVAGYPHITVPMGFVQGLPVGLSFVGRAWSEPVLLKLAYAFEQQSKARRAPSFAVTSQ